MVLANNTTSKKKIEKKITFAHFCCSTGCVQFQVMKVENFQDPPLLFFLFFFCGYAFEPQIKSWLFRPKKLLNMPNYFKKQKNLGMTTNLAL